MPKAVYSTSLNPKYQQRTEHIPTHRSRDNFVQMTDATGTVARHARPREKKREAAAAHASHKSE